MPQVLQLGAQRLEVVDFPVQGPPDRAGLVGDRLITGLEVDDAEAADAKGEGGIDIETLTVWAAVA